MCGATALFWFRAVKKFSEKIKSCKEILSALSFSLAGDWLLSYL